MKYSPTTLGFYSPEFHSDLPSDAIELTDDEYISLIDAQRSGAVIVPGADGRPVNELLVSKQSEVLSVTMRQARLALLQVGKLAAVNDALSSISDPQEAQRAAIEWEFASRVEKGSPLIQQIAPALGMTQQDLTDLFNLAATL